ncbi:MAG: type II toxin-antitoxin system RelE/ParE family toxin [Propionibacteriaceae bacterium]|jgi:proteic killer suppression protein|nr:type II toxin-antitoxin system RelE/ParE family toxin [Propionibacteriaceae bacterium]
MIRSFGTADTERIWNEEYVQSVDRRLQRVVLRKLELINAAVGLADLRIPPGNRLEQLKADRRGQWSIRVNDQWRICFEWRDGDADSVELVDYH